MMDPNSLYMNLYMQQAVSHQAGMPAMPFGTPIFASALAPSFPPMALQGNFVQHQQQAQSQQEQIREQILRESAAIARKTEEDLKEEYQERERNRDRDRRRDRDRDRERDRDRDRDRERDRDRDRDRDRGRDRDRERDRDRSSRRSRDKSRDRSRERDYDNHSPHDDNYNREERGGDRWMTDTPTNTILLKGLPYHIDERIIREEVLKIGATVLDVRLMRHRSTGASRGFAFVEFQNVDDAQRWMDRTQGKTSIQNNPVNLHYSSPRHGETGNRSVENTKGDWTCPKCGAHNFRRRDFCFKCNVSREEAEKLGKEDGIDQVGTNPCNTLILRGLDALTTEENIVQALHQLTQTTVKNILVVKDDLTNTSKGYAFLEFNSCAESMQILDLITKRPTPFEVDGKAIIVAYAKNTYSTILVTLNTKTPTTSSQYDYNQYYQGQSQSQDGYNYYDQSYYDQWSDYYQQDQHRTQTDGTNAAAAVAAAAIQQANAAKTNPPTKSSSSTDASTTDGQTAASAPDVSTFQYDETSGYYYDSNTGLYYDSSSQYFYNVESGQFLYWDNEKMEYLPAPDGATTANKGKKEGKKDKDRTAKKIAKDMEKWAKIVNNRKEMEKEIKKGTFNSIKQEKESASADAGFALLEKMNDAETKAAQPSPHHQNSQPSGPGGLVASYGGDSESDDDGDDESSRFLDMKKLACLLCKRRFPSKEILLKHEQMSQLHKDNLKAEIAKGNIPSDSSKLEGDPGMNYRDRAKERREKHGFSVPEPRKPRGAMAQAAAEPPVPYEQPNKEGIKNDNIGNRMLKKMGWSEGSGLGKAKQGIVDPIEASQRQMTAGLGARGSSYRIGPTDSYKEAVKKTMLARFKELQDS